MNLLLKNKIHHSLSNFYFFSGVRQEQIPHEEKMELENCSRIISCSKKTVLFSEGETPKGVYIILKGRVKISKTNSDGSLHNFFIFSFGELFGHSSILSGGFNSVTATTIVDCEFMFVNKENFTRILNSSPHLSQLFLHSLSQEVAVFVNQIHVFSKRGIKQRLALFLLLLNEKFKMPEQLSDEAEILLSRVDLANFTGTSIENLVRMLRELREKNYIKTTSRSVLINDFEALYDLAGV